MNERELKRFLVSGEMTVSCYTYVEAHTAEEAQQFANARDNVTLCYACSCGEQNYAWVVGSELDGTARITHVAVSEEADE